MAERGFGRGGRGGRGGKRGAKKGPENTLENEIDKWQPLTKLGRLVKDEKITSIDEVFRYAVPIKESQIVDFFFKGTLKEEVMQIIPVQKQTKAGQRTRFKAFMLLGDEKGHVALGWKVHKEVQGAIKGAILHAKLNIIPVRTGYWGNKIGVPHTVPYKVSGKSGSVRIRLVPGPRGTGNVAAPISKKVLQFAGIHDCYTSTSGHSKTRGNFLKATFYALQKTYHMLSPDLWGKNIDNEIPFDKYAKLLAQYKK
eukprot:TRINITY_DN49_c0_g2_i1.p2 TRINITY_DN49_c0_g2~~TRINITY_DN49_c0_g2_i1.p2  ORF type:complete len:254 (-),score=89.49 TRINITY_DN49_c0_g2_i1:121-882(-)